MEIVVLCKGNGWGRSVAVIDLGEFGQGILMGNDCDIRSVQEIGRTDVVGMCVTIYDV